MEFIYIRPKTDADAEWAEGFIKKQSNGTYLPELAGEKNFSTLQGWIAEINDEPVGLLLYDNQGDACHMVSLNVCRKRMGIGEALLNRLESEAKASASQKLTCVIGNDNLNALRFLQKRGFRLVAIRARAIEERRERNPTIQLTGEYGIPLCDEWILEKNFVK